MKSLVESAAARAGVPPEVLDLIGRDFILRMVEDLPSLLLPPIMETLKSQYVRKGLGWIELNASHLKDHITVLRQMYGPVENGDLEKPMYHLLLP